MQTSWNKKVEELLHSFKPDRMYLLKALHRIQDEHPEHYLSEESLEQIARYFKLTKAQVYGVVTYYSMFSTKPRKKYVVRICKSPVCYMKGSLNLYEYLKDNPRVEVEFTECLGQCDHAPSMMINENTYVDLSREKIDEILSNLED